MTDERIEKLEAELARVTRICAAQQAQLDKFKEICETHHKVLAALTGAGGPDERACPSLN